MNQRTRTASNTAQDTNSRPARRGRGGMDYGIEENARQAKLIDANKNKVFEPFRFYVSKGNTERVIILTESIKDLFFRYEHLFHHPTTGNWGANEECIKEFGNCPICEGKLVTKTDKFYSKYTMFLSVIQVLKVPYTDKNNKVWTFSRKTLPIQSNQFQEFKPLFELMEKENGTLRGMTMDLTRPINGQSTSIGNTSLMSSGRNFSVIPESVIQQQFQHEAILNKDNEVVVPANGYQQPIDFDEIYPEQDEKQICDKWGIPYNTNQQTQQPAQQQTQSTVNMQNAVQVTQNAQVLDMDQFFVNEGSNSEKVTTEEVKKDSNGLAVQNKDDDFSSEIPF